MLYLGISDLKCSIWIFLDQNFKKSYRHIWNQHPWICLIAEYREIMKMSKFGNKNPLLWYFWARILKNYCHISNQHLRISVIAKFCEENKMPKFGTKNALLGYFLTKNALFGYIWARIFKKLLSYLKPAPSNLCICKISQKTKKPKFGTKNWWFMYFWARIWKKYCRIWNQHPRICLIAKFPEETKIPKFGTKYTLFRYFSGYNQLHNILFTKFSFYQKWHYVPLLHINIGYTSLLMSCWAT